MYHKRAIEWAVREAVEKMHDTRRNPAFDGQGWKDPCDERLWANFAHATGDEKALQELCRRALSEYRASTVPKPVSELPKILSRLIKDYCKSTTSTSRSGEEAVRWAASEVKSQK